jgi:hypothetical protein
MIHVMATIEGAEGKRTCKLPESTTGPHFLFRES